MSCEIYSERITLFRHVLGDKWQGIASIGPVTVPTLPPDGNLTRFVMEFVQGTTTYTLDSDVDAEMVIIDAATWHARIDEVESFLTLSGKWNWNMQFYEAAETTPLTFYYGVLVVKDL